MIPKIIWQTHELPYNELPNFQKDITNTWKNLNPGWEYNYVSAEERSIHVQEYDNFLYECYKQCSGINQAEIWRIVILYKHGGFYADMDSICTMPLDDVISQNYNNKEIICSPPGFQIKESFINDSNFAAISNSKMIKSIIDKSIEKCKNIIDTKDLYSFHHPGSIVLNNFFNTIKNNKNNILFQYDYFSHSNDYKTSFNSNFEVTVNKTKINYKTLCIDNDWPIYHV
jgi:mannosyltransferase OCH1-like enzyme